MWKLGDLSPWNLVRLTLRMFSENQLSARCAQFAFYSMLAMMPLLIIIVAGVGLMPLEGVLGSFLRVLDRSLPPTAYALVESQIADVQHRSSTTYLLGSLLVFAFAGSRLFLTMGEGLNVAFGLPPQHRRARAYGLSLLMTLGMVLLMMIALALLVIVPMILSWSMEYVDVPFLESYLFHFVRWAVVTLSLLILTSAIYCFVPATRIPWQWLTPGNVFAVAGWMVASQGFRWYVENIAVYNQTYGTLGGVIVMLLWLYLTGALLFVGGQINGAIYQAMGTVDGASQAE